MQTPRNGHIFSPRFRRAGSLLGTYRSGPVLRWARVALGVAILDTASIASLAYTAPFLLLFSPGLVRAAGVALHAGGALVLLTDAAALLLLGGYAAATVAYAVACRRRCRGAGLVAVYLVPEAPALVRKALQAGGTAPPVWREAYSVHSARGQAVAADPDVGGNTPPCPIPADDVERLRHLLAGRAYALVPAVRPSGRGEGRGRRGRLHARTELEGRVSP